MQTIERMASADGGTVAKRVRDNEHRAEEFMALVKFDREKIMREVEARANRDKLARFATKAKMQEALGIGTALIAGVGSAYIDGRFDKTKWDPKEGDGLRIKGFPVLPGLASVTLVSGFFVKGQAGTLMRFGGLGSLLGTTCGAARKAGERHAEEAAEAAAARELESGE